LEVLSTRGSETAEVAGRSLVEALDALPSDAIVVGLVRSDKSLDESLHPALKRCKRFTRRIEVQPLTRVGREGVLRHMLGGELDAAWEKIVEEVVAKTPGWLPGDLSRLFRKATVDAKLRQGGGRLEPEGLRHALRSIKPRSTSSIPQSVPSASWEAFAGYEKARDQALKIADAYFGGAGATAMARLGVTSLPAGLFLYGPSGCGKTLLANALVSKLSCNLVVLKVSDLLCKYLGETEAHIRRVFAHAKAMAPCVVFFDEIDSLGMGRGENDAADSGVGKRALGALLNELDGVSERKGVFVIAATTHPESVDAALIRPGRFEAHVYLPLPSTKDVISILEAIRARMPVAEDVDLDWLAGRLHGATCATIDAVCREAALTSIRKDPAGATSINKEDFEVALRSNLACARPDELAVHRLEEFHLNSRGR